MKVIIKNRHTNTVEILGLLLTKDNTELYAIKEGDKKGFGISIGGALNESVTLDAVTLLGHFDFENEKAKYENHTDFFNAMFDCTHVKIKK